ncbi:uncharacterized protein SOCE26_081610 [Sorangium cellulosum]|uniref:DNA ligase ATP-dependent N-terminal domain-containing protein n=1 Tax=Sorangium cellulosum TaxID=56 RepID=A0A2L0F510_SORCE|nr:uncharacterized protein SOCE26_081610 [Sorangium cellulosum]
MLVSDLVATSERVATTSSRLEKISALADVLRRLSPDEVEIGVDWLSGRLRQGRIGLGPAMIAEARRAGPPRRLSRAQPPRGRRDLHGNRRHLGPRLRRDAPRRARTTARPRHRRRARLLRPTPHRRAPPGRPRGRHGRGRRPRRVDPPGLAAARRHARRRRRRGRQGRAPRGGRRPRALLAPAAPPHPAHARTGRRRHRLGPRRAPHRRPRVEDRRRPRPGPQGRRRRPRLQPQPQPRHQGGPRDRRGSAGAPRPIARARRRGDRAPRGRETPPVPGHHEPLRPHPGHRRPARPAAAARPLLRRAARRRRGPPRPLGPRARRRPPAGARPIPPRPPHRAADRGRGRGLLRRRDRPGPRGRHGQGARRALRGRAPRQLLAQGQMRAHPRPRRARGRVGERQAPRAAQQPPPRRPRPRLRRLRHARQDLQGHDRRDARLANEAAARARDLPRRPHRLRAARARRRGRLRRRPGEPPVPRRGRAPVRARQALPQRQIRRRGQHHQRGARPARRRAGARRSRGRRAARSAEAVVLAHRGADLPGAAQPGRERHEIPGLDVHRRALVRRRRHDHVALEQVTGLRLVVVPGEGRHLLRPDGPATRPELVQALLRRSVLQLDRLHGSSRSRDAPPDEAPLAPLSHRSARC